MSITYQHILVPLDGSERAASALDHAESIAKLSNAHLVLLQVIPSTAMLVSETAIATPGMGMPTIDPFLSATQFDSVEDALVKDATNTLNQAAKPLQDQGINVETVILSGLPADSIVTYAIEQKIDLIVMSTHGRTGLSRLLFGSVAESVLRHATCPIMLVRVASE